MSEMKVVDSEQQPVEGKKPEDYFFRASASDFKKIPDCPIAYWVNLHLRNSFEKFLPLSQYAETRIGLITGDNDCYIRYWHEVNLSTIGFGHSREEAALSKLKWFPQSKGGDFRRWYGNNQSLIKWENDGYELQNRKHSSGKRILAHNFNLDKIFLSGITWTKISSGTFGARLQSKGFLFNDASANAFPTKQEFHYPLLAFMCSKLPIEILKAMNPTLNFLPGNVSNLPISRDIFESNEIMSNAKLAVSIAMSDWNAYETSWDFTSLPLLHSDFRQPTLKETYQKLRLHWLNMTMKMQQLEEENNRIFIEAYGLQDELEADVPLKEITLTCNPHYRYGGDKNEEELEALLLADTMKEFISYAVGCMFGRYSLDKEGLILANQGETLADYLNHVPEPTFMPDDDNVIPVLDGEWFTDDVTERFRRLVKVIFGEEHYQDNLAFIEQSIGKDIRKYFLKDFYADHVKRYKKRPIYWMFSSPRGSFNALIYMHRYQPTTVSVVLNGYLREFRTKLIARKEHLEQVSISASVSQRDKTNALKEIEKLKKMIDELEVWERDVLYPLAAEQISIDLDDGVKANYPKFGTALKKVTGLS